MLLDSFSGAKIGTFGRRKKPSLIIEFSTHTWLSPGHLKLGFAHGTMLLLLYPHSTVTFRLLTATFPYWFLPLPGRHQHQLHAWFSGHFKRTSSMQETSIVIGPHLHQETPSVKGSDYRCGHLISHLLFIGISFQINSQTEGFSPLNPIFCNPWHS